jgi:hypothetical protein
MTDEMKQNRTNPVALLFKKTVESNLVGEIMTKSIFAVETILSIDSSSGKEIKSLDEPRLYSLTVASAVKANITNKNCYQGLITLLKERVSDQNKLT